MVDSIPQSLIAALNKAAAVLDGGLIQAGKLHSELTEDIHALARARFGLPPLAQTNSEIWTEYPNDLS